MVSLQIINKSQGRYHVVKTIGSCYDTSTIVSLYMEGKKWISSYLGEQDIFNAYYKAFEEMEVAEKEYLFNFHFLLGCSIII